MNPADPTPRPGPLAGVRVLDLTRVLAGPFATMMLADLGADVIKIESPSGDETRRWGPPWVAGESAYFTCVNRNKRGMVLDFTRDDARALLRTMVADADVLVENFRVGTMEKWGLGYEEVLRDLNPRLVYCSLTGYGLQGPDADRAGMDVAAFWSRAGVGALTAPKGVEPFPIRTAMGDHIT